jgi:hypothetical protein
MGELQQMSPYRVSGNQRVPADAVSVLPKIAKSRSGKLEFMLNELAWSSVAAQFGSWRGGRKLRRCRAYRSKSRTKRRLRLIHAQRSLDDPPLGQDDEFVQFVALDDSASR